MNFIIAIVGVEEANFLDKYFLPEKSHIVFTCLSVPYVFIANIGKLLAKTKKMGLDSSNS